MKREEILRRAQAGLTSRFDGGLSPYVGAPMVYTGKGDKGLSFTGGPAASFADEANNDRQFSMTISNLGTAAEDRVLALHSGYLTTLAEILDSSGTAAAAIVTDGTIISTTDKVVTCSGSPRKIAHLKSFVNSNPTRFTGLKMLVNDSDQFEMPLCVRKLSPFSDLGYTMINPSIYKNSNQQNDKRVEIPLNDFQLDDQTVVVFTLKAGRSVTFTFFGGAIRNNAGELNAKATEARTNLGLNRGI